MTTINKYLDLGTRIDFETGSYGIVQKISVEVQTPPIDPFLVSDGAHVHTETVLRLDLHVKAGRDWKVERDYRMTVSYLAFLLAGKRAAIYPEKAGD